MGNRNFSTTEPGINTPPYKTATNTRTIMARVLTAVLQQGRRLDEALRYALVQHPTSGDHRLIREVCYGVIRHYPALYHTAGQLLDKPLRARDMDITALILCGLYQLHYLNTAEHAAIAETVAAVAGLKKAWAKSLVNAVLRRSQREWDPRRLAMHPDTRLRYLHPDWLIRRLQQDWPHHWQAILHANNSRPPLHLRVDVTKIRREDYLHTLKKEAIPAEAMPEANTAIRVVKPVAVERLPGFDSGLCTVQDAGAQLAALLLQPRAGERLLDGCAAPGGKTSHLYQHCPGLAGLLALDVSPKRCQLLQATMQRTGTRATVICADICAPDDWWDGRAFDRILLDVPCSASGIIRRHPDIKLLHTEEQLAGLYQKQLAILQSAWSVLKPGGTLLYCTCSVFACENDAVIADFSRPRTDTDIMTITPAMAPVMATARATAYGRQLLPGQHDTDGFYYSLLRKNT